MSFAPCADDDMTERIKRGFDRFVDARSMSDRDVAALLRELEVDIAVDLNGYTGHGRPAILSHRACPVQVNYLGYPGTMGASFIDYIVADPTLIPPADYEAYAEKIVHLRGVRGCRAGAGERSVAACADEGEARA